MKRYIDAEALLSRLPNDLPYKASVKRVLMQAPTANAVEVVRCKDCKFAKHCYGDVFDCTCPITPWASDEYSIFTNANDYCSYGERREDNEG
jgi:hypothetical protein